MNANQAWIAMFRRIPAELYDKLALGLATGSEIVVQKIVKLDPEYMMIRGRLAGTQDTGRIVMVPYEQLAFVAIAKHLADRDVDAIFGKGAPVSESAAEMPAPAAEEATPNESAAEEPPPQEKLRPTSSIKRTDSVSKASLLAKLRDRLKEAPSGR